MHFRVIPLSATYLLYSKHALPMLHFLHLVTYPLNCSSVTFKNKKKQTHTFIRGKLVAQTTASVTVFGIHHLCPLLSLLEPSSASSTSASPAPSSYLL